MPDVAPKVKVPIRYRYEVQCETPVPWIPDPWRVLRSRGYGIVRDTSCNRN